MNRCYYPYFTEEEANPAILGSPGPLHCASGPAPVPSCLWVVPSGSLPVCPGPCDCPSLFTCLGLAFSFSRLCGSILYGTDEETDAQRGDDIYRRSHNELGAIYTCSTELSLSHHGLAVLLVSGHQRAVESPFPLLVLPVVVWDPTSVGIQGQKEGEGWCGLCQQELTVEGGPWGWGEALISQPGSPPAAERARAGPEGPSEGWAWADLSSAHR